MQLIETAKFFFTAAATLALLGLNAPLAGASLGSTAEFDAMKVPVQRPQEVPESSKADAEYNIGVKYLDAGNDAFAAGWFRKAAAHGQVQAQSRLGLACEMGLGTAKNYGEALKWYRLAAAKNDKEARFGLGRLYAHGHGVRRDDAVAAKWFRLAADQGLPDAQYALGLFYQAGRGLVKDDGEAYFWLALASQTLDSAMNTREAEAKQLTEEQLQAIRSRLLKWKPAD